MARRTTLAFWEAVRIALGSLWAHKMRSVLTLLGVVIGVTSVIAVVSIISGLNGYVAEKVFNLGADVFVINRGPSIITNIEEYNETQKRRKFTMDDYEAILSTCKTCRDVGAAMSQQTAQVKYGMDYLTNVNVRGWTPSMTRIYDTDLVSGRHITEIDLQQASPVCTVGMDIVEKLLPGVDPMGKEIRVDNEDCTVIGVGKKQGSVLGQSRDDWVIIPITNYLKMYGTQDQSVQIWVKGYSTAHLENTMDEVRQISARAAACGVQPER